MPSHQDDIKHAPAAPASSSSPLPRAKEDAALSSKHAPSAAPLDASSPDGDEQLESKFTDEELLKTRTIVMTGTDPEAKRAEIREYFHRTFTLFERLHDVLVSDEVFFQQPDKLRHPLIFYLCHTAVLYINKLRLAKLLPRIDETIESTCAVGVDEMSWDDLNDGHYVWPTPAAAREYRNKVRVAVDGLIQRLPLTLPISWDSPWWILLLGCEHERIHLETSSVLIRQLPLEFVKAAALWQVCPRRRTDLASVPSNVLVPVAGGKVTLGRSFDSPIYGWDLEYGTATSTVASFTASKFLVSNAEFYQFILDGGYETKSHWTDDGWHWVQWKKATAPLFWRPVYAEAAAAPATASVADGSSAPAAPAPRRIVGWKYRAYAEELDMPWDWPVDCNQLEAKAFCNWKATKTGRPIRLPTEEEWTHMRDTSYPESAAKREDQPYWDVAPGNLNLEHWASSCPVDAFEFKGGLFDVLGNVWQHTETPLTPFTGFKVHPIYDDFSVPTFDTRHNVIKGGSWASTGNEATRDARYAFRRHFYQHAGFRYVESTQAVVTQEMPPPVLPEAAQWAEVHWGAPYLGVQNYPAALVALINGTIDAYEKRNSIAVVTTPFTPHAASASTAFSLASPVTSPSAPATTTAASAGAATAAPRVEAKVEKKKDWAPSPSSAVITGAGAGGVEGRRRALDMGCAAGRATMELAKHYHAVLGLDLSTRLFRVASVLQQDGVFRYQLPLSGDIQSFHSIELATAGDGLVEAARRCEFLQADACNMDPKYRDFDLILASNVLSSLYAPAAFLAHLKTRLRHGGYLAIADTWQWNEKVTPREAWLGGYKESAENVTNLDGLEKHLGGHFTMIAAPADLPWVLRHAERSFEYHISQITIWRYSATHTKA